MCVTWPLSHEVSVQLTPCSPPWRLWDDALLYLGSRVELINEKLAKIESFCFNFFNLSLAGNFAAALGLSLVVASRGYCLVAGHGLCIVVASL